MDLKLWAEARDIAKDQMRHGKIHYSDFEKTTKSIYEDLIRMESGPFIDVKAIEDEAQKALPVTPEPKIKHEIVNGMVRCAECGKLLKSISGNHLSVHKMTRLEYMAKHGVSDKEMQGTIERKVRKGENNALKILSYIMKEYGLKRDEVKPFVAKHGFNDLKDLMIQAKDKNMSALDLLKERAPISEVKAE